MAHASVKGPQTWRQYPNYCLGVSLCSRNHEGEALEAIIDWINKTHFNKGIIDLSNTLHRYNFMIEEGLSEDDARRKTLEISDKWFNEHHESLTKLQAPYEIISWDRWLSHPKFIDYESQFRSAFSSDENFRKAVLTDVGSYFRRRFNMSVGEAEPEAVWLSASFLIEELAAHSILYEDFPCAVIYPGRQQESFKLVREGKVPNVPKGMQKSFHTRLTLHNFFSQKKDCTEVSHLQKRKTA